MPNKSKMEFMFTLHARRAIVDYPFVTHCSFLIVTWCSPSTAAYCRATEGKATIFYMTRIRCRPPHLFDKLLHTNTYTLTHASGPHLGQFCFNYASKFAFLAGMATATACDSPGGVRAARCLMLIKWYFYRPVGHLPSNLMCTEAH